MLLRMTTCGGSCAPPKWRTFNEAGAMLLRMTLIRT